MSGEALRVITEPLGGGPLARAALDGTAPAGWYEAVPADAAAWRARAETVRAKARGWLAALQPAFEARGAAHERLARVSDGRGVVVTTGQQPGLFGGPVYTWTKALTALALADAIEAATGVPTAPVFWAATDDADFTEASGTHVAVPGGVESLRGPKLAPDGTIMARAPLGDVSGMLDALHRGAGAARWIDALEAAAQCYHRDATIGGAYVALLRRLLEPLGIAVLDASHPATRRATDPHLRAALAAAPAIDRALAERTAAIRAQGMEPQVAEVAGLSLVFDGLEATKRRVTLAEAASVAASAAPGSLGGNVLLRPVVERAILPTVAYAAGPGELAYFAQVSAVAEALGAARPLAVPRWSATILEPHVQRILARLELTPDDLRDPHAAETRLAQGALPDGVEAQLAALRAAAAETTAALAARSAETMVPPAVLEGVRRQIEHRVERLERRLRAAAKRRAAHELRDVATARGALWPLGHRQERTINFLPLLARHGQPLVQLMRAEADRHAARLVGAPTRPPLERAEPAAR